MQKQYAGSSSNGRAPDPEVSALPKRRTFTGEYKLRVLEEVDAAQADGEVGAILRREALYSSHLAAWRKERRRGSLVAMSKKRGRPPKNPVNDELVRLRRENAKLKARLAQAEVIIDVQKKVASILGIPLNTPDDEESDS